MIIRSYPELRQLVTFEERFEYLQLKGRVGASTFGFDRIFNQIFYKSDEWKAIRNIVIIRDNGYDLGVKDEDHKIIGSIYVHHMNPVSIEDIEDRSDWLLNPDFLISTIFSTHNAIHYGNKELIVKKPIIRTKYDTCPWRH